MDNLAELEQLHVVVPIAQASLSPRAVVVVLRELMEQAALALQESLTDRFRVFTEGMTATSGMLGNGEQAKQEAREALRDLEAACDEIAGELSSRPL